MGRRRAQADGGQRIDAVLYVEENPDDRGTYYVTLGTEDYPERYLVGDMYGEPSADRAASDFVEDVLDRYRVVAAYEIEDYFYGAQLDEPVVVRGLDLGMGAVGRRQRTAMDQTDLYDDFANDILDEMKPGGKLYGHELGDEYTRDYIKKDLLYVEDRWPGFLDFAMHGGVYIDVEDIDELIDCMVADLRHGGMHMSAFDAPHASDADELAVLALRQSLEGENQAIYDYQNWVNQLPEGHPVREGLIDIMREERAHVGELQQMLFEMGADEEGDFEGGRREVGASCDRRRARNKRISDMDSWFTYGGEMGMSGFEARCGMRRFAYTVKDNITKDVYDCETVGDLEDCLRDITPEDAPGYELIDDVAQMANDNYFVDLENALGVTITANRMRRDAAGARRRKSAGMYDIPGGAIETYQEDGRWYARAFQYGEYATGRCYGRSEEEAVNKCKRELGEWGVSVANRRARRNAPHKANRRKVAANGASFSNGWTMYLDTRSDGSFSVTLYDPDGHEHDYGKTFEAGDEYSLVRQLKGIMAWRAPMGIDDYDKIDEMAAKAFGRYGRRAMRMRAANTNRRSFVHGKRPIRKHATIWGDTIVYILEDIEREAPFTSEKELDRVVTEVVERKLSDPDFLIFAIEEYGLIDEVKKVFIDEIYDYVDRALSEGPSLIADEYDDEDMWY